MTVAIHTMQVPYLDKSNVIVTLVHHVTISKEQNGFGESKEEIFAFVIGLEGIRIGMDKLLEGLRHYWENPLGDHQEVGLTPRLFIATILKLYGFQEAQTSISSAYGDLQTVDYELPEAEKQLYLEVRSRLKVTEQD